VFAVVAVGLVLTALPRAFAVTSHKPLNDTRPVVAGPVHVAFPIEYFGVVADLASPTSHLSERGAAPFGAVRFEVHGVWTGWQPLDQDGAQAAGHFTGSLVGVDRADAYQVRGLPAAGRDWRAAAINTTDGPTIVVGHQPAAAQAATACMSRADWGADESITAWSKGTDTPSYYPVQTLTVHHTAGSNDLNQDYAATVRAIYSYDIQTNGWSDMAYQYLIDGRGVVYEGRNSGHTSTSCLSGGGDGSDFGHQAGTDYVVTGAHVAGYNAGNVGVALMGCYDPSSACSGNTTPPSAAVDSLENLLAQLSTRHGLNPQGTVNYVNPISGSTKTVKAISGHRDWVATACPGGNLYADLPAIRANVAARLSGASTPSAPGSLSATVSGATVSLSWTAPASDGGSAVSSYQLFRGTSSTVSTVGPPVWSGNALNTTDSPPAGTYYYAVRACNAVGCGASTTAGPVTVSAPARITSGSCSGSSCTFTGAGTGTLHWNFGNGSFGTGTPVSVRYTAKGSYTVTLTDAQPTSATRAVTCPASKGKLHCST
jgi:hypothetical protein